MRHYDQGIKLFFEAKNPEKAYEAFKKAIAIEPSLDLALFYLAQIDLSGVGNGTRPPGFVERSTSMP